MWPIWPQHLACLSPRNLVSLATALAPAGTRESLAAQRLVVVLPAASAFRRGQLAVSPPGKQPGFHVLVCDIVAGLYLTISLADFRQHSLLVRYVGFDRIRDEKIRTAPGNLGQPSQPLLGRGL